MKNMFEIVVEGRLRAILFGINQQPTQRHIHIGKFVKWETIWAMQSQTKKDKETKQNEL